MRFKRYIEREEKQYLAHLMYNLGIQFNIAKQISSNQKVFTLLNEAQQNQTEENYDKIFKELKTLNGVGSYRAKLYIEKYFESPYQSINWKMFEILKEYQSKTKWSDRRMYDLARKIDDPSEIWNAHLEDPTVTIDIASEIYKMTTSDDPLLQAQTIEYFAQHLQLKLKQNQENILTIPKFMFNEKLNEKYHLFLEVSNHVMLLSTAKNYRTVYNYFNDNGESTLEFEMNDIDTSDFASDQLLAFEKLKDKKTMLLTGFAGTGKTYMLDKYIKSLDDKRVYACSLAGKAVKNFVDALSDDSKHKTEQSTIAGLRYVDIYRKRLRDSEICIVDEASMISMSDLAFLIRTLEKDTKLVLIGDINQLPAIELDVLNWLVKDEILEQVTLDIPKRQGLDSGIFKDSMDIINYKNDGNRPGFDTKDSQIRIGQVSIGQIINENRESDIFLTTTNKVKDAINNYMSMEIRSKEDGHSIFDNVAYNKDIEYHEGEKIMIGANNPDTGFMNGDIFLINYDGYLCDPVNGNPVLDISDKKVKIGNNRNGVNDGFNTDYILDISAHKVQLAFAITTHKSQGSTLSTGVTVMAPGPLANKNLLYTALTRFKEKHTLYIPNEETLLQALNTEVKWQSLSDNQRDIVFSELEKIDNLEEENEEMIENVFI